MDLHTDGYNAVRRSAGMVDLRERGILRAAGRDRVRYLHNMLSNGIHNLKPGEGCYAMLLTNQGRMESDLHVYAGEEELWIECPLAGKDRALANLEKYLVSDLVEFEDWTGRIGILSLQGPEARQRMQDFLGTPVELNPLEHRSAGISENSRLVRRDRTGSDGYDLWLPEPEFENIWNQWVSGNRATPVSAQDLNRLRTEAGIPWFGVDMDSHNLPLEFGLTHAISLNKGCYRGQEIMARVTYRGRLNRGLAGIAIVHPSIPPHGADVFAGNTKIGEVTSAAFSPKLQAPLALALLRNEYRAPGTQVMLTIEGNPVPGEVVALPISNL